ncbi:MAG: nicotinate (nicotinamide) nucleotide adenylyltransferase [Candidatus Dormibacteria bacterium]
MTAERPRVAVLGGTFDPVHNGHLGLARLASTALGAAECWLVPAAIPPSREPPHASAADRLTMLQAASGGERGLRVLDVELRRGGVSYTADTLEELSAMAPALELWWVLGADAARSLPLWRRAPHLLATARFAVVAREPGATLDAVELSHLGFDLDRTVVVPTAPPPVSATRIRAALAAGEDVAELVPAPVLAVIRERRLYNDRG